MGTTRILKPSGRNRSAVLRRPWRATRSRSTPTCSLPPLPGPMRDPATAFARMSRAVRLTLALEARTAEALRALRAGLPLPLEKSQRETSQAQAGERVEAAKTARSGPRSPGNSTISPEEDVKDGDEFEAGPTVALRERLGDHEAGEHSSPGYACAGRGGRKASAPIFASPPTGAGGRARISPCRAERLKSSPPD